MSPDFLAEQLINNRGLERGTMTNQKKFRRFFVTWVTYVVAIIPVLKWVLVPRFGDVSVVVAVVLGFLV